MTARWVPPKPDLEGQLDSIAARLIDIAGCVASEAEEATSVVRSLTDQVDRIAFLASGLEAAAGLIEQSVQKQVDTLALARASLVANVPVIESLEQSVASIASISTAVSSIARESRILSLNARIEAARAGSAGSAFNVVATEMAVLTDRTKQATDEIGKRSAVITQDVGAANAIVGAHARLVMEQDDLLAASLDGASAQRQTAVELSAVMDITSVTVNQAASAIGRVGANATAVKLLAKQLTKIGQRLER